MMTFQLPAVGPEVLSKIASPMLVVFRDRVISNIEQMIRMAGSADRLRPHCKTHKMAAVVQLLLERGISKHKAATIAEVEMLAAAGATDILLAYNPVGPNIPRVVALAKKYPAVRFAVTADHPEPVIALSDAAAGAHVKIGVMLDVNTGQNRTGVEPDAALAFDLYSLIAKSPGLTAAGFHVYDGHQRHTSFDDRRAAVAEQWERVDQLRRKCEQSGLPVPTLVCGGTPTFPVYAEMKDPAVELSPGTCIFHDAGYGSLFIDLPFQPAAAVLTRVVSRPAANRATLDIGNKAVAADPPKGHRVYFPDFPEAAQDIHNEEHMVIIDDGTARLNPGDTLFGIPMHICPTSALYEKVCVVENGNVIGEWPVTGRNRQITI